MFFRTYLDLAGVLRLRVFGTGLDLKPDDLFMADSLHCNCVLLTDEVSLSALVLSQDQEVKRRTYRDNVSRS